MEYGIRTGLTDERERIYTTNLLLDVLRESEYEDPGPVEETAFEDILAGLLEEAARRGILESDSTEYRDLFDTRLMNCLMPRPAQVTEKFRQLYQESPRKATDYFYKLSQDSDYIRRYRVKKDIRWKAESPYGELDISIKLSKP